MTDKQIIINDVDVSGCWFHFVDGSCTEGHFKRCKDNPNCHYKNWQRKERECERWKKANDEKNELLAKMGCPTTATAKRKVFTLQQQLDKLKVAKEQAEQKLKQIEKLCIKNSTKSSFCNGIENKDMQKLAIRILQIVSEVK